MNQDASHIIQDLLQLKKRYERSECVEFGVMHHYFKQEYIRLKNKLLSLERLAITNNLSHDRFFNEAQMAVSILGLYLMV